MFFKGLGPVVLHAALQRMREQGHGSLLFVQLSEVRLVICQYIRKRLPRTVPLGDFVLRLGVWRRHTRKITSRPPAAILLAGITHDFGELCRRQVLRQPVKRALKLFMIRELFVAGVFPQVRYEFGDSGEAFH